MNVKYLALLAAIGFVAPVEATPFIIVADIRFFLASSVPSDNPMVREYVPSGETLENWEQLVAVRVFPRLKDPHAFLDGLGHQVVKRNPETRYWLVQNNETKDLVLDFMAFPPSTTKPFYADGICGGPLT